MTTLKDVVNILSQIKGGQGSGPWGHDGLGGGGLSAIGSYLGSPVSERRTAADKLKRKKKGYKKGGFNKRKHR